MADELIRPFAGDEVGRQSKAPALPSDLDARDNLRRENLPEYLDGMTSSEIVPGPAASTAALMAGAAGPYDMSALEDLLLVVDDYEGRKNAAATKGMSISGFGPGVDTVSGASDQAGVSLHGEAAQQVILGATLTDGPSIAAAIQVAVRALSAASAENQEAYDGFLAEYSPPSFSTTLAADIPAGPTETHVLKLASVAGLDRGDELEIADQAGGPEAPFFVKVIDIRRFPKEILVAPLTPGEIVEAGALVRKRDDYYKFTSGKGGSDSAVAWSDGLANDMAVALKLTAAEGAAESPGRDAVGVQRFSFEAGDFVDPAAATAAEIALVMNKSLTGAIAADNAGTLEVTTRKLGASANLLASEGASKTALGLPAAIELGTQTDLTLSMRDVEILQIQTLTGGTAPGAYLANPETLVRVEGDKLVEATGVDYSGGGDAWRVTYSPKRIG